MTLKAVSKKIKLIPIMLVVLLTLFCINTPIKAEEINTDQNLNITNRKSFAADGYEQSNKPENIIDDSMSTGNGKNWYGGTRFLLEYRCVSIINSIGVYTTENWGYSFKEATIYYSEDDSLNLDSDLSNFKSVKVNTESIQTLSEPIKAKRIVLVKGTTNAVYEFKCFGTYKLSIKNPMQFAYTGDYQEFIAPETGQYKIELWGAQGGGNTTSGFGGYTKGIITLKKDQKLYVYVGNKPKRTENSFNGGGQANNTFYPTDDGGGATDIRLVDGNWDNFDSLKSRIMVAGGGGGYEGFTKNQGASAGGLEGYNGSAQRVTGGTQISGGSGFSTTGNGKFGIGGNGELAYGGGAGGGGYYGGGGAGNDAAVYTGAGGSSFISGHEGCDAVDEISTENNIVHKGQSIHYSNLSFTDTIMIDGNGYNWTTEKEVEIIGMPTYDGTGTMIGNTGDGYAKITPLGLLSKDNYLSDLTTNYGTLSPNFNPLKNEYTLILSKYDQNFTLSGILSDENSTVTGLGKYTIEPGEAKIIEIIVTAESGDIKTYTINATRETLNEGEHSSKLSKLEIEGYETELNPEFHPLTNEYSIQLYLNEIDLNILTDTFDNDATVEIVGNTYIKEDSGIIIIKVSAPNVSDTIYKINYTKNKPVSAGGILSWAYSNNLPDGNYNVRIKGTTDEGNEETIIYPVELINYYDDVTYTLADADENGYIHLGDDSGEYKMLIVKYHKNLTIEEGVTLTANTHTTNINNRDYELTYKKGMYIHIAGTLTNNGTISMTARGTYNHEGENVYLIANEDGSYEYVPAVGATGAKGETVGDANVYGKDGSNGIGRQTAGGGSGARVRQNYGSTAVTGSGSTGTSYSGGSGGAAIFSNYGLETGSGQPNGGPGGDAIVNASYTSYKQGGGAGNPGGLGKMYDTYNNLYDGETGTGGLLVLYSSTLNNNGTIESNGSRGGLKNGPSDFVGGAGSGGGSVNIFYNTIQTNGTMRALAGEYGSSGYEHSGKGGTGTVTQNQISYIPKANLSKDNYLSELTSNYGTFDKEFNPLENEYTLTLSKYDQNFTLSGTLSDENATVIGLDKYNIGFGETKVISVIVTAPSGYVRTYTVNVTRESLAEGEHSSKLSKLQIEDYEDSLTPEFHPLTNEYNIELSSSEIDLNIVTETFDSEATVEIIGNRYIKNNTGVVTIRVSAPNVSDTIYTINYNKIDMSDVNFVNDFNYTGDYQTFTIPISGQYKIELWGASGGKGAWNSTIYEGGRGAYAKGVINLRKGKKLYVYIGGKGLDHIDGTQEIKPGGYNGGGHGNIEALGQNRNTWGGSGGGATDIRLVNGQWNDFNSLKSRIMVAGAGGGGTIESTDTAGINGGNYDKTGQTVTSYTGTYNYIQGKFGIATDGPSTDDVGSGGGGSGYYGGGVSTSGSPGFGGTSYISGYVGVDSIDESSTEDNIIHTGNKDHYSGYIFTDSVMKSGLEVMPTHDETGTMTGNTGDGYAKITYLKSINRDNYLSELTTDYGILSPSFNPLKNEYTLTLSKYDQNFTLSGTLSDENATVTGLGEYKVKFGETKTIEVIVTAESGDTKIYTVNVEREKLKPGEHSSKLSKLEIEGYEDSLEPEFHPLTNEYSVDIYPNEIDINLVMATFDEDATIKVEGNRYIKEDTGVVSITVSAPSVEDTIYKINYTRLDVSEDYKQKYDYKYTGDYQTFIAPIKGKYTMELWGAQGGNASQSKGAYTKGDIKLNKGQILYVYVGKGRPGGTSFNGGSGTVGGTAGGGATDIRLEKGDTWRDFNSLKSRIMVAAGSGSGNTELDFGYGGTLEGGSGKSNTGGTQIAAGGPNVYATSGFGYADGGCAGGGGYYGGGSASCIDGAGGGSSFISGYDGSDAIDKSSTEDNIIHTGQSIHYSGLSFTNPVMIAGNKEMPTHDGSSTMTGNEGDGYAKITSPLLLSKDNYLSQLIVDKGVLTPEFDPLVNEYNVELGVDDTEIKISARPSNDLAVIEGLGTHKVPGGTTTYPVTVTSESGDIRVYNINVTRPSSSESKPTNIKITGLVPSVCDGRTGYCTLDNEFDSNINEYHMTVPAGIRDLEFTVEKSHDYQTVTGDGVIKLVRDENVITIVVTSEDNSNTSTYTYYVTRDMTGDNYIDRLELLNPSIDIGFHYLITEYAFKVDNNITSLDMNIVLDDENASYEVIGNSDFTVGNNIVEIRVTAANGEERSYILNVYRVSNGNALLESLTVSSGSTNYTLSPEFNDITTNYTLTVDNSVTSVNINATAQEATTSVTGTGTKTLKTGLNMFDITTSAEDGTIETYKLIITRKKSDNNYLSNITVSEGNLSPSFNENTNSYEIRVNPHVKRLTLGVTLKDSTAKYEILGNSNFKIGENLVTIKVTAENGNIRNYYIVVTKEGSDNNYLSSLNITNASIAFNKETLEYNVTVENSVKNILISGSKEDTLSTVTGLGNYNLTSGNNKIKIRVTSETGKIRDYIINVFRKYNADASLREIRLSSGTLSPKFSSNVFEYKVNVDNEIEKIVIDGIPNESTTTVDGNGSYDINVGNNEITLKTLSEDNTTESYKIIVVRDKSSNANLSFLSLKEGILSPEFDKMTVNYTALVPNDITSVNVVYTTENALSDVTVTGNTNLELGENTINVIVTAEDGNVKTYEIKVTRQERTEDNLDLKTLDLTSCTLNPEFSSNIVYYECTVGNEITSTTVNASAIDESNTIVGTGEKTLKVGQNTIGIKVINKDNIEKDYQVTVTREKNKDSRLNNIIVENHTLNETFNKDTLEYSLVTQKNSININAVKLYEEQDVQIIGNSNFKVGLNTVTIKVSAEDRNYTSTYTLNVLRERSDNNYLSNLYVEGYSLSPSFNKGTLEYSLTVENEVNSIIVNGEKEDISASVSGFGMYTLQKGLNEVKVTVTSESGISREYTININKLGSRNNYLSNLSVKDHTLSPEFNKSTNEYNLEIDYDEKEIEVVASKENENSTVIGDGIITLSKNQTKHSVVVTSENGDINTYYINIIRKDAVTSKLSNIEIKDYYLDEEFDSNKTNYTVRVDNEVRSLDLKITKLDPNGTYVIEGNENFEVGLNTVKIISTSSDGNETTTYTLTVYRQEYANTYLSSLNVTPGAMKPSFNKTNLTYTVTVPESTDSIVISASPENVANTVGGTGEKILQKENNLFKVTVTTKGGIVRTYSVIVNKNTNGNSNIRSITTNVGTLTKLNKYDYELVVPKDVTQITKDNFIVTLEDEKASVTMDEVLNLTGDSKIYKIVVISADGSNVSEYMIHVKYLLSGDSRIRKLNPSSGELTEEFNKDKYEYTLNVFDYISEVEFNVILNEENAKVLNSSLVYELNDYTTLANITVQAEDGTNSIYTINIEKSLTKEKHLQNIDITLVNGVCDDCILPKYNETTYDYEMNVPYDVDEIDFVITKKHQNQVVKIYKNDIEVIKDNDEDTKYSLDVGLNNYRVEVTNSLGEKIDYNYVIERLKSNNNYLRSLKLISPEYEIENFDKENLEYSVQIPYEYENITVEAIPEDVKNATVKIEGYTYLLEGNNDVKVTVTSGTKEKREYILHVLRTPESNNLIKTLTVSSGDIYELTPRFTPGINDYTLTVPSVISKITIEAIPDLETTTVTGEGEYDLKIGINKFILESVSKEGHTRTYVITITRESSKNVYLKNLQINNGILKEEFRKERTNYNVEIGYDVDSLDMLIEKEDEESLVEVVGNKNLLPGENIVKIRVKSRDLSVAKTYVLNVVKDKSPNNNLSNILVDDEQIEGFDLNKTEYNITVENDKTSIDIKAISDNKYATVSGNGVHSLNEGLNQITIGVTAQNGDVKDYIVNVIRKKNTYLSAIVTDRGEISPKFDKKTMDYILEVERDISDITIIGLAEDMTDSVVTGNGKYTLEKEETKIILTVSNGEDTRTYNVNVIRRLDDNNNLKYLTVAEGLISPVFDKDTLEYTVTVPNDITSLSLDYEVEDSSSTVSVIGNDILSDKINEVIIRVTSEQGSVKEYKIIVTKDDESLYSNKLIELTVNPGQLTPVFNKDTNLYEVTVTSDIEEVKVGAVRESKDSTVLGIGTHKLVTGRNVIPVQVTSKDGKIRVYTIIVYKEGISEARLESLEFEGGRLTPEFNKNTYKYTLLTKSDINLLKIKNIETVDKDASYIIEGDISNIKDGNVINIKVTSKDKKETRNYQITLRLEKSNNVYLKELNTNIGNLEPTFDKNINKYKIVVSEEINSIYITASAESIKSTVDGTGLKTLNIGANYVNITVTSENGFTNIYSIEIVRGKSSNNNLKDLLVRGYELNEAFDKDTLKYSLTVPNDEISVVINAEAEDVDSNVTGIGKVDIDEGLNIINVTVTAADGSIKTYTIEITRERVFSSKIKSLEIKEGVLSPTFNSDVYDYNTTIPNEYTSITPIIELEEKTATYEVIGNENLRQGSNEIQIKVTSENNEESIYRLNVVRLISSNNYLSNITASEGTLVPSFDKEILNYTVTVENSVEEIQIDANPEINSTTVKGIGTYKLNTGENIIILTATSSSGIERNYKVKVIREYDSNNYLSSLTVNEGNLVPAFDKTIEEYDVVVPDGTEKVEIIGTKEVETSVVSGFGTYDIQVGTTNINIKVTSENGDIRVYKVNVIRNVNSNTNITEFSPSEGILSPAFDNSILDYELRVGKDVDIIDFEIGLESELSNVIGNKNIIVDELEKEVKIIVTAEDGSTRVITVSIIKESSITDILLTEDRIMMAEDEEYQINASVVPDTAINKDLIYQSEDGSVASVSETGKVTGHTIGSTSIVVKSKENENIEKTIIVNVVSKQIKSEVYDVLEKDEGKIVIGAEPGETIKEFIEKLLNEESTIEIYDKDGNKIEDHEDIVKTGQVVKLVLDKVEYDSAIIIVRGDSNEDGIVDVADRVELQNHILSKQEIVGYRLYALDVENDEIIDVADNVKLSNYILSKIDTLN